MWWLLLLAVLVPRTAFAFLPSDLPLVAWWKADAGVFKDAGTTPAANNDTVQQWNDQSGHGNNLTQGTAGSRPTYKTAIIGSQAVVRCDGAASLMTGPAVFPTSTPWTLVVVAVQRATSSGNMVSGTSGHAFYFNNTTTPNVFVGGTIELVSTTSVATGVTGVHILEDVVRTNSHAAQTESSNLYTLGNYNTGQQDNNSNSDANLQLCAFNSANFNNGDIAEAFIANKILKQSDYNNIISYENGRYGTSVATSTVAKQLVFDGDSITAGLVGTPPFAHLVANNFGWFSTNLGSQGANMTDLTSQAATLVDPLFIAGAANVDVVFAGTNDIALSSSSAASVYASYQTYCAARHAVGWKVVVIDMLPRGAGSEAARTTLNADFDADTCADAHVKTTCNTSMWAAGANTNTTWYAADQIHPNTNGHSIIAGCLETAISSIPFSQGVNITAH